MNETVVSSSLTSCGGAAKGIAKVPVFDSISSPRDPGSENRGHSVKFNLGRYELPEPRGGGTS
jgi:hypothetical protein